MSTREEDNDYRAIDALGAASAGLGGSDEQVENAKVYAMIGIGWAVMAAYDVLIEIRRELEHKS